MKKIAVFGCKHTTRDLIVALNDLGYRIDTCITISEELAAAQQVAGYYDLAETCAAYTICRHSADKYNLTSPRDIELINDLHIDLALAIGWQRLIPHAILSGFGIGAFGMHGSSEPLPHGRGRSPMNWSLIQDKKIFYTHLFKYEPGVDDGRIVGVQKFDINEFDDCHTLHLKNLTAMVQLCRAHLPKLLDGTALLYAQPKEGISYYPKRSEEDGLIFFEQQSMRAIYNLVRGVTRPFPGAFAYADGNAKVRIWVAIPFDTQIRWPDAKAGQVVELFYDGTFVVSTIDGSLLVTDYTSPEPIAKGMLLSANGRIPRVWENLPD
jgi:methionyl-tRNA formyltransferase